MVGLRATTSGGHYAAEQAVRAQFGREQPDAKLILVGHSMGGLVARYFLECLEGWRDTRRVVTFGTPYRGCPGEPYTGAGPQLSAPPAVLPAATGCRPSIYKN